jgi:TetR/AcrR family transcriptional regulator
MPTSTKPVAKSPRLGTRGQPERTRTAILEAAILEFAREGLAGARTDAIARAAGVNKALLYYYFRDKEALYAAVLDHVFSGLRARILGVLERDLPPGELILAWAAAHFDYIASNTIFPRVVMMEMSRIKAGSSPHMKRLVETYFRPVSRRLFAIVQQGIQSGEFRRVDAMHFIFSVVAMIVFYFSSVALIQTLRGVDPLAPEEIAARRAAVLDTIRAALFADPGVTRPRSESLKGERA